jgi:branched-chain amino acid transport system permease protein
LYLGLVFLFMVMYAPGGIASLIMMNLRVAKFWQAAHAVGELPGLGGTGLVACWVRPRWWR